MMGAVVRGFGEIVDAIEISTMKEFLQPPFEVLFAAAR